MVIQIAQKVFIERFSVDTCHRVVKPVDDLNQNRKQAKAHF